MAERKRAEGILVHFVQLGKDEKKDRKGDTKKLNPLLAEREGRYCKWTCKGVPMSAGGQVTTTVHVSVLEWVMGSPEVQLRPHALPRRNMFAPTCA